MEKSFITILNVPARRVQTLPKKAVRTAKQARMAAKAVLSSEEKQLIEREKCIIHSKRTIRV